MFPKSFIPTHFSEKNVSVFVMRTTYVYFAPPRYKILIMFGEQYEIWGSSLRSLLHFPVSKEPQTH